MLLYLDLDGPPAIGNVTDLTGLGQVAVLGRLEDWRQNQSLADES